MTRNCPECKKTLEMSSYFFCTFCGHKLEDSLIDWGNPPDIYIKYSEFNTPINRLKNTASRVNSKINYRFILISALVLLLLLGSLFIINKLILSPKNKGVKTEKIAKTYFHSYDYNLPFENNKFYTQELTVFAPFNVDFYLEGVNISKLTPAVLVSGSRAELFIKNLNEYLEGNYAVFGKRNDDGRWTLGIVFKLNKSEGLDLLLEQTDHSMYKKVIGKTLVLTNNDTFLKDIELSSGQIEKNVAHIPKFSSYKALLPQDGQLVFMSFLADNNDMIELARYYQLDKSADSIINNLKEIEFTNFVIRKNE